MSQLKRILCVDDDPDLLRMTRLVLERRGYMVYTLNGAARLVETVRQFSPDLIFIDHRMPDVMGTEATRGLKSDPEYRHIPVIYFTEEESIQALAEEAGADDWLPKPFQIEELMGMVNKYLGSR
ncbi:MAG TPA: response regulator [Dinghuibacter sp.]|uniref:response regulator n=1 Tax=Dinghuibacter sp. TaxID=2024697 RepID=UPI002C30098B|nr:response regulator [Dinghuibacter sp.]HTJ12652.1 response regulator [Dinghuibacter sp.]